MSVPPYMKRLNWRATTLPPVSSASPNADCCRMR